MPPLIPFPHKPKIDQIEGVPFCWYIHPEAMQAHLERLSSEIVLKDFTHVLYVLQGGKYLYTELTQLQGFPRDYTHHAIEYHRHPITGDRLIEKAVAKDLSGDILIIDDVWDTANTAKLIIDDIKQTTHARSVSFAVVCRKINVPEQRFFNGVNLHVGVEVENLWLGGCGMDLGVAGAVNQRIRQIRGLVVKS